MRVTLGILLILSIFRAGAAWADADEYTGQAWNPTSTAAHPCGIGMPQRGNFPRDFWVNDRKPVVKLIVRQEGARLCYVNGGIAEAPVIRVRQGQALTIVVRNEITDPAALEKLLPPVAKRDKALAVLARQDGVMDVVPDAQHAISGRTNLHVHGFAVPPVVPQDEVLMGCADPAVGPAKCGQREIVYKYQVPADMPAGLYWYHPHVHGEVQAQMLAGLSGAIVVEGADDQARDDAGIPDRVFIVRQSQDADGKAAAAAAAAPVHGVAVSDVPVPSTAAAIPGAGVDTRHEMPCAPGGAVDEISLNGGPVVDGAAADKDLAPLTIMAGTTQLWRVLNAATDAFLDLALLDEAGKPVPIRVLARDGAVLTDDAGRPSSLQPTGAAQLVPPAGRVEFYVAAPALGQKIYLVSHAVDTGCAGDVVPERRLGVLTSRPFSADDGDQLTAAPPAPTGAANQFAGLLARKTDRERVVAFAEYPRPGADDQNDFYIAERRPGATLVPFRMDAPPSIIVKAGAVEEWNVENWTNEVHAFHIHQVHFRVLSVNGQPVEAPPLLDTATVPAAVGDTKGDVSESTHVSPGRVRIKLYFPETLAGDIPFHCHLVDHEDNGMMGVVRVVGPASAGRGDGVQKTGLDEISGARICRFADGTQAAPGALGGARFTSH
jgi:FtsP/CotA-like multicopper oxidase with cupredoxin domain